MGNLQLNIQDGKFQSIQQVGQYVKLRGDAALEQEVARVVETELSRGQVEILC